MRYGMAVRLENSALRISKGVRPSVTHRDKVIAGDACSSFVLLAL